MKKEIKEEKNIVCVKNMKVKVQKKEQKTYENKNLKYGSVEWTKSFLTEEEKERFDKLRPTFLDFYGKPSHYKGNQFRAWPRSDPETAMRAALSINGRKRCMDLWFEFNNARLQQIKHLEKR